MCLCLCFFFSFRKDTLATLSNASARLERPDANVQDSTASGVQFLASVLLHLLVLGAAILEPDRDRVEVEVGAAGEMLDHARVRILGIAREALLQDLDLKHTRRRR